MNKAKNNWEDSLHLRRYPLYCSSMSLDSVRDWMASSKTSAGTSPVGRTTLSRSGVDMSDRRTEERIEAAVSSSTVPRFALVHSCTAVKIATYGR